MHDSQVRCLRHPYAQSILTQPLLVTVVLLFTCSFICVCEADAQRRSKKLTYTIEVISLKDRDAFHSKAINDRGDILLNTGHPSPTPEVGGTPEPVINYVYRKGKVKEVCKDSPGPVFIPAISKKGDVACNRAEQAYINGKRGPQKLPAPSELGLDDSRYTNYIYHINSRGEALVGYGPRPADDWDRWGPGSGPFLTDNSNYIWSKRKGLKAIEVPAGYLRAFPKQINSRQLAAIEGERDPALCEDQWYCTHPLFFDAKRGRWLSEDNKIKGLFFRRLYDLNDRGQALGYFGQRRANPGESESFHGIYNTKRKRVSEITAPDGWDYLYPEKLNNSGTIFGWASKGQVGFNFVRDRYGKFHRLTDLLVETLADKGLSHNIEQDYIFVDINNKDQILLELGEWIDAPTHLLLLRSKKRGRK